MSNINILVNQALLEEKGQTAGAEMYNTGAIAGLYSEPKLTDADGSRGHSDRGDSAGEPVVKTNGGNESKYDVDAQLPNPSDNEVPVTKYGGSPLYSAAQTLKGDSNPNVIKSPLVKNTLSDQPEM